MINNISSYTYHHGGARLQQQLHASECARQRRQVQRRRAILRPRVDVPAKPAWLSIMDASKGAGLHLEPG